MSFASVLDAYCNALDCTNKDIAARCGVSPSALSRYRNGERAPEVGSEAIDKLVTGLSALSLEQNPDDPWQEKTLRNVLEGSLSGSKILGLSFGARLNALMALLDLRNAELARATNVSPSYVSRIRSGQRMPANQRRFAERASLLIARRGIERGKLAETLELIDSTGDVVMKSHLDLDSQADLAEVVEQWLLGSNIVESDLVAVEGLFEKLNDFYFNRELERISVMKPMEPVKVDSRPFSRFYYGAEKMREAERAFFDLAAALDASEVYLSSDMPLLEMTIDPDFADTFRMRIGALMVKGTKLNVIHTIERPLAEAVAVLEMWLPLYLTGQVTPYYLKGVNHRLFFHVNYASDVCALSTEAMMGHQEDGRSYLSTKPEDVAYYQRKMGYIMERVSTMLEIYREGDPMLTELLEKLTRKGPKRSGERVIGADKYENLCIVSYPGNCAIVTILCDPAIHLVIRHPKLRYVIAHMR